MGPTKGIQMERITVSERMTGKLKGIAAINTACSVNPYCQSSKAEICAYCYAKKYELHRPVTRAAYEKNFRLLTERIIPTKELPLIDHYVFPLVRFHAFGELWNRNHFINFMNIAYKNRECRFALWTKRPAIVSEFEFMMPDNLSLVLSIGKLNTPDELVLREMEGHDKFKTAFVVGRKEDGYKPCGEQCIACRRCYEPKGRQIIHELLH